VTRFLYRFYLFCASITHWLQRRLTAGGWLVVSGLALTAGFGADPERAVAYQAFSLLLALMAIAIFFAPFFRNRFTIQRILPRFGSVGQPLVYSIRIGNQSRKKQAGLSLQENIANPPISFHEFLGPAITHKSFQLSRQPIIFGPAILKETVVPDVLPKSEASVPAQIIPMKRGSLRFTGVTVTRPDPFNLFRGFIKVPAPQSVLVLPRRYHLPPVPLPGYRKYQLGGVALAMSIGESEEFVSLRDYHRGDPLRHIHWKSWAKVGKPIVREFEDEFFVRHALLLDTFARPGEIFEEAVSVAASFAATIDTQESLLDLMFIGPEAYCFTAGRGVAHSDQMLEILASVQPCHNKSFADLQNLVVQHSSILSGCVCVFMAWDAPRQELVRRLLSFGLPLLVLVLAEPGGKKLDPGPMAKDPGALITIELGKIQEGLNKMTHPN
jgi:hypothetical protein